MPMPESASPSLDSTENKSLAVVILAAGKGTRMNDPQGRPKVLVPLNGKAMIDYVLEQAGSLTPRNTILIVGHRKDAVIEHVRAQNKTAIEFAEQREQNGTGHAVMQAQEQLRSFDGDVLILSGDVPLLRDTTLRAFQQHHREQSAAVSVLSVSVPDATGYGRIVRDGDDAFLRIVEHKDAGEDERRIDEINSGVYLVDCQDLFSALARISSDNAQGELYLTDIIEILRADGKSVNAWQGPDWREVQGVNTREQLLELEKVVGNAHASASAEAVAEESQEQGGASS